MIGDEGAPSSRDPRAPAGDWPAMDRVAKAAALPVGW
jgi:hypothetical protein